jgi:MerR family transcriptional regulator, heat shock protein HspR
VVPEEDSEEIVYYHITVVSRLLNLSPRTIMRYERLGLIRRETAEFEGRSQQPCFAQDMVDRLRRIKWLTADMGVNLAGVELVLQLLDQLEEERSC